MLSVFGPDSPRPPAIVRAFPLKIQTGDGKVYARQFDLTEWARENAPDAKIHDFLGTWREDADKIHLILNCPALADFYQEVEKVNRGADPMIIAPSLKQADRMEAWLREARPGFELSQEMRRREREAFMSGGPRLIDTSEFKAWFGKSKIVDDATGEPLIVNHGTTADWREGVPSASGAMGPGIYLSNDVGLGTHYSDGKAPMFLYARVENPYAIDKDNASFQDYLEWNRAFRQKGADKALQALGYDGVVLKQDGYLEVVVFHPNQIKSVDNCGAFDPDNPDIMA